MVLGRVLGKGPELFFSLRKQCYYYILHIIKITYLPDPQ